MELSGSKSLVIAPVRGSASVLLLYRITLGSDDEDVASGNPRPASAVTYSSDKLLPSSTTGFPSRVFAYSWTVAADTGGVWPARLVADAEGNREEDLTVTEAFDFDAVDTVLAFVAVLDLDLLDKAGYEMSDAVGLSSATDVFAPILW